MDLVVLISIVCKIVMKRSKKFDLLQNKDSRNWNAEYYSFGVNKIINILTIKLAKTF